MERAALLMNMADAHFIGQRVQVFYCYRPG